jgi:hypothetical protein
VPRISICPAKRGLDAVGEREPPDARLDVLRRGIEGLAELHVVAAAIVLEQLLDVGRRRDLGALGLRARHEQAEHAVGGLEIVLRGALHIRHRHLAQLVAIEEEQPPVADRGIFRERADELAAVELRALDVVEEARARPLDLCGGDLLLAHTLDHREQRRARLGQVAVFRQLRAEIHVAGIVQLALRAPGRAGESLLHQRAVQAAGRGVAQDLHEDVDRRIFRMAAGDGAIERRDELLVADAAQGHRALAILRRLLGVERGQGARRLGDRAEMLGHQLERARLLEAPGDQQHCIVGLIPGAIERLQLVDRHALDVGALADGRIAIVVPRVGQLLQALEQHRAGAVLAHLEFVAHHGHLAVEVLARDARVHHAIGFHGERPVQVFRRGRDRLEVVGAVVRGRAVPARAAARELALDVGEVGRALEQHVLEQVRHAFLAVAFVARADQVDDVHGDRVGARIGQGEDLQAVGQPVFGDPLDRRHALRQFRGQRSERPEEHYRSGSDSFHGNQWNKWRATRPAGMVAKVRPERQATARVD